MCVRVTESVCVFMGSYPAKQHGGQHSMMMSRRAVWGGST